MTVGIFMLDPLRAWLNKVYIVNVPLSMYQMYQSIKGHLPVPQKFFLKRIPSDLAFTILQRTPVFFGPEKLCFLLQNTLYGLFALAELSHFSDCMVYVQSKKYLS